MNQEVNPELFDKIMRKIEREKALISIRRNFLWSFALFAMTAAGLYVGSGLFLKEAKSSGFFDFISLGLSDFKVISQNFNEFVLSIAQALPIDTLIVVLSLFAGMIWSIRSLLVAILRFRIIQDQFNIN